MISDKNTITGHIIDRVVASLPHQLLQHFSKQDFYSPEQVAQIYLAEFNHEANIDVAYALFCTPQDYAKLASSKAFPMTYQEIRLLVAKRCFDNWPRFNFESLLTLSAAPTHGDLVEEVTDLALELLSNS